ncbi:hypothetical protein [Ottowia sp.]|uniref:hypothetical protein n=1 Tax=Ottowia sp. TaxID=1898956 RepID=UPI003A8B0460
MQTFLNQSEPEFSSPESAIGGLELARYAQWVRAAAVVNAAETGQTAQSFIENEVLMKTKDPRKVLAVVMDLSNGELEIVKRSNSSLLIGLRSVIQNGIRNFPGNEFYIEAYKKLSN